MILSSVELSEGSVQGPLLTLLGLFQAQCCEITLSFPSPGSHSSNVPAAKGASSCVTAALFSVSLSCINSHGKVSDFFWHGRHALSHTSDNKKTTRAFTV